MQQELRRDPANETNDVLPPGLDRASDRRRKALADAMEAAQAAGQDISPYADLPERARLGALISVLERSAAMGSEGAAAAAARLRLAIRKERTDRKQAPTLQLSDSVTYLPPEVGEAVMLAVGVSPERAREISRKAHRRVVKSDDT